MTPAEVCRAANAAGLTMRADGRDLVVKPAGRLTPRLRMLLVAHKPEILSFLHDAHRTAVKLVEDSMRARLLSHPSGSAAHRRATASRRDPDALPSGDST